MQGFLQTPWNATSRTTAQVTAHPGQEHKQPTIHDPLRSPSHEQDPWKCCPHEPGAEGRSTHAQWAEQYTYQHRGTNNQQGRPPRPRPPPHPGKSTACPNVLCYICPQYGIIFTLKIPAVSSGATWMLQLWNFLRTCITQGPEYFRHRYISVMCLEMLYKDLLMRAAVSAAMKLAVRLLVLLLLHCVVWANKWWWWWWWWQWLV